MARQFTIGTITVPDPTHGTGSLDDAFELLCQRFPAVRHSAVFESDGELDTATGDIIYTIPTLKAKTNG